MKHIWPTSNNRWLEQWNDIHHYHQPNDFHYELGFAWLVKGIALNAALPSRLRKML